MKLPMTKTRRRKQRRTRMPGEDDTDSVEMVLDCSMDYTVTFSNWNAASEFEIPEEVIKEAENTKSKQEQESEDE